MADIELGTSTDTQDAEGEVTASGDWSAVTERSIEAALPSFLGRREQVPPMYSALKHRGVPLYTLARRGEQVEREARMVETYALALVSCDLPFFRVEIKCSRGMYVRVLAEEIGARLGVPAHLKSLVRTRVGRFGIEDAVPDDAFDRLAGEEAPGLSMAEALSHLASLELEPEQLAAVRNGHAPRAGGLKTRPGDFIRLLDREGRLCAIAEAGPADLMKLRRVFSGGGPR
jgi:tRNA pseudouridine55 synthase